MTFPAPTATKLSVWLVCQATIYRKTLPVSTVPFNVMTASIPQFVCHAFKDTTSIKIKLAPSVPPFSLNVNTVTKLNVSTARATSDFS